MKKIIYVALAAFMIFGTFSCTKEADVESIEPKLPSIKLSSLGTTQTGPFTTSTVLQLLFGASTSNTATGKFTLEILDGTTVVKTVNFNAWKGNDDTSVPATGTTAAVVNHVINYNLIPNTYPNTQVYGGSILLKLSVLGLTSGKTYTVRASAFPVSNTNPSVLTMSGLFRVQ